MKNKGPKILLLDIETSYLIVSCWGIWQQIIRPDDVIEDWSILSWSAKWLGKSKVLHEDNRKSKNVRDDKAIVTNMHKLMSQADIIVTQNGKKFDIKKLNTRFIMHKLKPLAPFKHFDTRQVAKNRFGFTSNSLKDLAIYLGLSVQKSEHKKFPGKKLWDEVLKGNIQAWNEMHKYNDMDVIVLEGVYLKLRPWDQSKEKIDLNAFRDKEEISCNCGSKHFQKRGYYKTKFKKVHQYQCQDCGDWFMGQKNLYTRDEIRLRKDRYEKTI